MRETSGFELNGWRRRWLGGLAAGLLMIMFFVNTAPSSENNLRIAFIQALLAVTVISILPRIRLATGLLSVLLIAIVSLLLVGHFLAVLDGLDRPSMGRLAAFLVALLFPVIVAQWVRFDSRAPLMLAISVLSAMLLYTACLALAWQLVPDPRSFNWYAATPLFRNIRHAAYALSLAMICGAWILLTASSRIGAAMAAIGFCIVTAVMFWSGSRGAFLAGMIGVISLLCIFSVNLHKVRWLLIFLCLPIALLLSLMFTVDHPGFGFFTALRRSAEPVSMDEISNGRLQIWKEVCQYIIQRPWFGWGGEAFARLRILPGFVQAHNGLLQLFLEWGLLVTTLLISLLSIMLLRACKMMRRLKRGADVSTLHELGLGLALACGLLSLAMVDGVFYHGVPQSYLATAVGLLIGIQSRQSTEKAEVYEG